LLQSGFKQCNNHLQAFTISKPHGRGDTRGYSSF
jgi:hypothetical protein